MTIKEFWDSCFMTTSRNGTETKLIFKNSVVAFGSKMGMKMEQELLLEKLIKSGEVII